MLTPIAIDQQGGIRTNEQFVIAQINPNDLLT